MASASGEFHPTVSAPAAARAFLQAQLVEWQAGDLAETAAILLGELAANVVRHARTNFVVGAEWSAPTLRVEVRNGSSIVPAIHDLAGEHGGYGLRLVSGLASEWGIEQRDAGKAVWFVLARGARATQPG